MPPEEFEKEHHEYSLRGNPSLSSIVSQVQADFFFYEPEIERTRLEYKLLRDRAVFLSFDAQAFSEQKGGLFAIIRASKSADALRLPFGKDKPPVLVHVENQKRIGSLFIPKFIVCNIGGLAKDDLYLASYSNTHLLTPEKVIDYMSKSVGRPFDLSSLVSVFYIAGFNVEDETQVPDIQVSLPLGPAPVDPPVVSHEETRWEPSHRRKTVWQLQREIRRYGRDYRRD
jgi:hypothetical protein